jgi:adenosylmethionine---8-amino-7-oxononanoate aminotransferase
LPFSAVLLNDELYELFYLEEEKIIENTKVLEKNLQVLMHEVAEKTGALTNIRGIGGIVAADLNSNTARLGYHVYQKAVELGALLRPLGNTIYWLPPLNTSLATLQELRDITVEAINTVRVGASNSG